MKRSLYTYRQMPPEWRDCDTWPLADVTNYDEATQNRFERLARGIRLYLQTGKLRAASQEAQCSPAVLLTQLNRCISTTDSGQLVGWAGLIRGLRFKPYCRKKDLPRGKSEDSSGRAGAMTVFLERNPEVLKKFKKVLKAGGSSSSIPRSAPTLQGAWQVFRNILLSEGFTDEMYPLNSKTKGRVNRPGF